MTLWSDLYPTRHLISRQYLSTPGVQTITAPYGASILRASAVGAGGWKTNDFGAGAAFSRVKLAIASLAQFSIQVGDIAHSLDAGDVLGDSLVTRVSDSVVILKAQRGGVNPGLAANGVGDAKFDGFAYTGTGTSRRGGVAAGDDADQYPLGFGGRGGSLFLGPVRGGGGAKSIVAYQIGGFVINHTIPPGLGLVCVEFYSQDPGY